MKAENKDMAIYKKFEVFRRVKESDLVVSLYLKPADGEETEPFKPGQHLSFRINIPGHERRQFRNYSFSDAWNRSYYRISVKKELPLPGQSGLLPGVCSSFIVDELGIGDILEAKGPAGSFYLDPLDNDPVALYAGGIGITPLLSMIKSIAKDNPTRTVYFIYGVNERKYHSFYQELNEIRQRHPSFHFMVFYANVGKDDRKDYDYDYQGFIKLEEVLTRAGHLQMHHYICGPAAMINFVTAELKRHAVSEQLIHVEAFNMPVSDQEIEIIENIPDWRVGHKAEVQTLKVIFKCSGKEFVWDPGYTSILDFAEDHDMDISSGCKFGDCGTCLTKIIEGEVKYIHPTMVKPGMGYCLLCSCIPAGNITLNV